MPVNVVQNGIEIGGTVHPLYCGAVHYWRHERNLWPEILDRVVEMGFRFIETYIPWSVHEIEAGSFDFGMSDERKNVGAFIKLCGDKGLFVLVRPGPHINSELTYFGYPERIFERKEMLSRTAEGAPAIIPVPPRAFPAPSYASMEFYKEVGGWFDAVCPVIRPLVYPDGPVVGVQSDNEMSFFFRTAPFDQDYSDASIDLYHDFLRKRHGTVEAMGQVYGQKYARFQDVLPPREFAAAHCRELPYYLDWVEYKEFLIYYAVKRIADMLRERGLNNVFYFHNFPKQPTTPMHAPGLEDSAVDIAGADLYAKETDYEILRDTARFLHGSSRLPFIPEFGAGCWLWWRPLNLGDHVFANRAVLMNGVKAVSHYMLADRDRWYGAPVARDGRKRRKRFDFYTELNRFLAETRFHDYAMQSDAVLLHVRDYERFEAMNLLTNPLPAEVLGTLPPEWFCTGAALEGLRDPIAALYRRQHRAFKLGFSQAGYTLALADSDVPQEYLDRYKVVIAPSFDYMGRGLQRKLLMHAIRGGVVVLGPRAPLMDELMRENTRLAAHLHAPMEYSETFNYNGMLLERVDFFKAAHPFLTWDDRCFAYERPLEHGSIIFLGFMFPDYTGIERAPHVVEIVKRIAAHAGLRRYYPPDDSMIETVLHTNGASKILFAANPTGESRCPAIEIPLGEKLVDWHSGEKFDAANNKVPMEKYTIRIFCIE